MTASPPESTGSSVAPGDAGSDDPGLRWTVVVDGALEGARNMARDHALALSVTEGRGVVRFYGWRAPTLSLGRNEPARGRFDVEGLAREGIEVVRRPTGGRAVLHHREVTYAVCVPLRALGGPRAAYHRINRGLVAGLRELGVAASLSGDEAAVLPPDAGPCFRAPAPGEVTARGRKLVGSAQARLGGALLQHGSLLVHDDQHRLDELRGEVGAAAPGAVALEEVVDPLPATDSIRAALASGLARELGGDWTPDPGGATFVPASPAFRRVEEEWLGRYRASAWTWRR